MNLPFFKKTPVASKREYLLALEIDHSWVKSAVWSIINDKPQVVAVGATVPWDDDTPDSLLQASDASLSPALNQLDPKGDLQPSKVILGLPPDWLQGDKIDPSKARLLKTVTQSLSLNPVGYVITPEAAVRYLQSTEGAPPTAILIGIWPQVIEITLVRLGKIDNIQLVKRSGHPVADVVEGFTRFSQVDMFPSRMLLYDSGSDLEDIRQLLLAHPWQAPDSQIPFLHFPKIETLPFDFTIRAITLSGGREVAESIGLLSPESKDVPSVVPPVSPVSSSAQSTPRDLGFFPEEDVSKLPTSPASPVETFAVPVSSVATSAPEVVSPPEKFKSQSFSLPKFSPPRISLPHISASLPVILLVSFLVISAGLFAAYWYLPRATVVFNIKSETLTQQLDLIADTSSSTPDLSTNTLPARTVESTSKANSTTATTGTKLVGDKATGTVSIINGTASPRTLPSGTVISSPSGLQFTFDSEVKIASASGTADPNSYQPGKADVKVTASQIGSDSNISAGTQFKIGSYSTLDIVAKNDAALSGGTSRQAKVVAKEDLAKLRSELTETLKQQAKSELSTKVASGDTIVPESIQLQNPTEEPDHKIGDEAEQVTLTLTVTAKGISFSEADLKSLLTDRLTPLIPAEFTLDDIPTPVYSIKGTESQKVSLSAEVSATLFPKLDNTEIIKNITGKSLSQAENYLQSLPGVAGVSITIVPKLPAQLLTLPHVPQQIILEFPNK